MTIKKKIISLSIVSLLGLLIACGFQYLDYLERTHSMKTIIRNINLIDRISTLTHVLQEERGWVITMASSKNQPITTTQKTQTNDAIDYAYKAVELTSDEPSVLKNKNDTLEQLAALRSLSLLPNVLATIDGYNIYIQYFIDAMEKIARDQPGDTVSADIVSAHIHLMSAKESLGRMRATLGYWTKQKNQEDQTAIIHRLISLQNSYNEDVRRFKAESDPVLFDFFIEVNSEPAQAINIVAKIISADELPREMDSSFWWPIVTKAMNQMEKVESRSLESIKMEMHRELAKIEKEMHFRFFVLFLGCLIIIVTSVKIIKSLFHDLEFAIKNIEQITSSRDFCSRLPDGLSGEFRQISKSLNSLLATAEQSINEKYLLAATDPLTGISNRLRFNQVLNEEINRKNRTEGTMSLILFDVDHFKQVNDIYGHNIGDEVLVMLARLVASEIRDIDLFARWGGEEFTILLKENNHIEAISVAEKLRNKISLANFPGVGKITCSFGVTTWKINDVEADFIERADKALYCAKKDGRNRVAY